jgi:hypothetical protein
MKRPWVIYKEHYERGALPFSPDKLPLKQGLKAVSAEITAVGILSDDTEFLEVRYIVKANKE